MANNTVVLTPTPLLRLKVSAETHDRAICDVNQLHSESMLESVKTAGAALEAGG